MKGAAEARPQIDRQPDDCDKGFSKLPQSQVVGVEARAVIKRYEKLIEGPVNSRIHDCYAYNESVREGLSNGG